MARFHMEGKVVDGVDLLKRRYWAWRVDVWPFAILYVACLLVEVSSLDFGDRCILLGAVATPSSCSSSPLGPSTSDALSNSSKAKDFCSADACKVTKIDGFISGCHVRPQSSVISSDSSMSRSDGQLQMHHVLFVSFDEYCSELILIATRS